MLTLSYSLDGITDEISITLDDTLDGLEAPRACGTCMGSFASVGPQAGEVTTNLNWFEAPTAPYVVVNEANGAVAVADVVEDVVLPGENGDRFCVFRVSDSANSPALCDLAR